MSEETQPGASMDRKIGPQQLDLVLRDLDALPTFPSVVSGVLGRMPDADAAAWRGDWTPDEELIGVLSSDVSLAARLLSLASQARGARITTVRQAVVEVGPGALRSAVLSMPVFPARLDATAAVCVPMSIGMRTVDTAADAAAVPPCPEGLADPEFWRHCVAAAAAAEMLVREAGAAIDPAEACAAALLHDLGKLALDTQMPKTYRRVLRADRLQTGDIAEYERRIVGVDHSVVGCRLAERWRLPEPMRHVLWLTHQPVEALPVSIPPSDRLLIGLVALADTIAREQGLGFSGNFRFPRSSEEMARQLGVAGGVLASVAARLSGEVEARCRRLDLRPPGGRSDRRVLAAANAELGRLNEELRRSAQAARSQAEAFDHLCRFAGGLDPHATVWQLLVRIAESVASAGRLHPAPAEPILAYSVCDVDAGVSAVRYDGTGRADWRTFARQQTEEPAVPPGTADAEEILSRLVLDAAEMGDWGNVARCGHLPLVWAGSWVGGVFYPAPRRAQADRAAARQILGELGTGFSLALSMVQARARAERLGEQLAAASQALAAAHDALAEAKTLAAVGEMAAGAAHELNTPLAVISGRAQLMRERADRPEDRATWQLIADQAQRVSDILSELMELASPREPAREAIDVGELLAQALESFRSSDHAKARDARVDIEVAPGVPPALADRRQIRMMIEELLANAATAAGPAPQIRLSAEADEPGGAVLLTVRDNGPGMDQKTLANAFTPFFSSQRAGRRCGLGLPRAKRYVENNGGRIWIRTQPGEGTTVYVQLPPARSGPQKRE